MKSRFDVIATSVLIEELVNHVPRVKELFVEFFSDRLSNWSGDYSENSITNLTSIDVKACGYNDYEYEIDCFGNASNYYESELEGNKTIQINADMMNEFLRKI